MAPKNKYVWKIMDINPMTLGPRGWGIFVTIFFAESLSFVSIHLNTWKYNVRSIKPETKPLRLKSRMFHCLWFHNFCLLPVNVCLFYLYFNQSELFTEVYHIFTLYTCQCKLILSYMFVHN